MRDYACGKQVYDKRGARTVVNKRWKEDHVRLREYQCSDCGGWHVTHLVDDDRTIAIRKAMAEKREKKDAAVERKPMVRRS